MHVVPGVLTLTVLVRAIILYPLWSIWLPVFSEAAFVALLVPSLVSTVAMADLSDALCPVSGLTSTPTFKPNSV